MTYSVERQLVGGVWETHVVDETTGGGSQTFEQVLTAGNDAGGLQAKNLADPTDPQDADTQAARDAAIAAIPGGGQTALLAPVHAVSKVVGDIASAPAAIDGYSPSNGDRILVASRGSSANRKKVGVYTYNGVGVAMTRTSDMADAAEMLAGVVIPNVANGNVFGGSSWYIVAYDFAAASFIVGTDEAAAYTGDFGRADDGSGGAAVRIFPVQSPGNDVTASLTVLDMDNLRIVNLGSPSESSDAATKGYVDAGWRTVTQTADQAVIDSGGLVASELTFPMLADTKYRIRGFVFIDTTAIGDYRYGLVGPSDPVLVRLQVTRAPGGEPPEAHAVDGSFAGETVDGAGIRATVEFHLIVHNGSNADAFVFMFAQGTATADTGAIVRAGSYIEYAAL